ncbi:MAG TPA: SDR family NAD(P)-dependent oxidoreductase [Xanthobacteraceae bacterium]|nr:SDR family NAD(P)-dependent oxidoreductase [Xanthobacteraceae bacterium]
MNPIAARPRRRSEKPVLITGGCGFIGCNLADAIAGRGERVLLLDTFARRGAEENATWLQARHRDRVEIVNADVRDAETIASVVADARAVLHLAAQVAVTTSLEDPHEDFTVNAAGTLNVLEAVRRRNPDAPVIFASTNKVYGKIVGDEDIATDGARYVPADARWQLGVGEQAPLDLYSPYGCSKGAADQYVHDYARVFALRTVVMRMSCIYGPRQFGNEDQGWIAHFLLQAIRGQPITIYGTGLQVRDALFIDDAVAAWLSALDRIDIVAGRVFNLGGGPQNALSLLELIDMIGELHGSVAPEFGAWRPGDQPWYVSDVRAIAAALDWRPRTALRAGLRALDHWLTARFGVPAVELKKAHA